VSAVRPDLESGRPSAPSDALAKLELTTRDLGAVRRRRIVQPIAGDKPAEAARLGDGHRPVMLDELLVLEAQNH